MIMDEDTSGRVMWVAVLVAMIIIAALLLLGLYGLARAVLASAP